MAKSCRTGLQQIKEILRRYEERHKQESRLLSPEDFDAHDPIGDHPYGYHSDGTPKTADEYYEEWGRVVEEHPITSPRRR